MDRSTNCAFHQRCSLLIEGHFFLADGVTGVPVVAMGQQDCLQYKLSFNKTRPQHSANVESEAGASPVSGSEVTTDPLDAVALLTEVRSGLRSIDSKIDTLTNRLDHMHDRIDKHGGRLDQVEPRISAVEDEAALRNEQLLRVERVLTVIKAKNKDLEACFRQNNIRDYGCSRVYCNRPH